MLLFSRHLTTNLFAAARVSAVIRHLALGQSKFHAVPTRSPSIETQAEDEVLLESVNGKGVITLNRPKTLHTLNMSMVIRIQAYLKECENYQDFVLIKSSGGKAFCAGADMRQAVESVRNTSTRYEDLFGPTYALMGYTGSLRIPSIALMDGITMGGGVGLSVHGKYRVATENTIFAMPENKIGHFPDCGTSYFLPRLFGKFGLYLALTGEQLVASDVFRAGIATHVCNGKDIQSLERDLLDLPSPSELDIEKVLMRYHVSSHLSKSPFSISPIRLARINEIFSGNTVEDIFDRLYTETKSGTEGIWAASTLDILSKLPPISLKITLKLMNMNSAPDRSLKEAVQTEFRVAVNRSQTTDFTEGIRAMLIDKDNKPTWSPKLLHEVTPNAVDSFFEPMQSLEKSYFKILSE